MDRHRDEPVRPMVDVPEARAAGDPRAAGDARPDPARPDPAAPTAGDVAATDRLTALVDEHGPSVFRLARTVVRDDALADDVAQETFIKVWRHLDDFRGEGSMRGWILRIAHHTAVSTLRTIRDRATDPERFPEAVDPIPTSRVIEGRLAAERLRDAIDRLDALSREIVLLREVEAMPYEEIAATLDVPVPTVKTRLLRARRSLAVDLAGWWP